MREAAFNPIVCSSGQVDAEEVCRVVKEIRIQIGLVVIDEGHLIMKWKDFD